MKIYTGGEMIAKSLMYRLYSAIIAFVVFYYWIGQLPKAGMYTFLLEALKFAQYLGFEYLWKKLQNLQKLEEASVRQVLDID